MREIRSIDPKEVVEGMVNIPRSEAVYAIYERIDIDDITSYDFKESINEVLASTQSVPKLSGVADTGPYNANISLTPKKREWTETKEQIAEGISKKSEDRSRFAKLLVAASTFRPPLKIGRTKNIQSRVGDYKRNDTRFSKEIEKYGMGFTDLVIVYIEVDIESDRAINLLEFIAGSCCRPRYAKRTG